MKTRTLKQIKSFSIIARQNYIFGQELPSIILSQDEVWESNEKCNTLLNKAIEEWKERQKRSPFGVATHKPELNIYWKTIEIMED